MYSFIINSLFIYLLFFYLEYTGVYQSVNIPLEFPYSPGDVSGELIGWFIYFPYTYWGMG